MLQGIIELSELNQAYKSHRRTWWPRISCNQYLNIESRAIQTQ